MTKKSFLFVLWTLIIGINFYFIYNFPLKHFNQASWNKPFGPLLQTHIVLGIIAIITGPLQFVSSFRIRYPRFHKLLGKIYLLAVLFAAISASVIAIGHNIMIQNRIVFGTGLLGLATAWLLTSGMAFWAIKNRNFAQHREWMIKSFVVTCGFKTYRIFAVSLNHYLHIDYKDMSGVMAWACWSIPLLVTELLLQAGKIKNPFAATQVNV